MPNTTPNIKVYKRLQSILEDKRQVVLEAIHSIQESKLQETKSTTGDKHETGRALAQLEQDNLSKQLMQNDQLQKALHSINPEQKNVDIQAGSLVYVGSLKIYIGVALGEFTFEEEKYFAISLASPMGRQLQGKKKGESVMVQGRPAEIKEIH